MTESLDEEVRSRPLFPVPVGRDPSDIHNDPGFLQSSFEEEEEREEKKLAAEREAEAEKAAQVAYDEKV